MGILGTIQVKGMTKAAAKRKTRHEFEHRTGAGHERSDPLIQS